MKIAYLAALAAVLAAPASAQDAADVVMEPVAAVPAAQAVQAVQAYRPSERPATFLPANTEILLSMNQEVTTKGQTWSEGDNFNMTVVHDVMLGDYVVIPKGTRGVGKITWLTSKGAFGKSGKMDIELDYLDMGGRRIPINGTYRQEGEGNTVATVGGVLLAGVFAGFITGKSGRIPQGRELMATLESDLPVALPAGATVTAGGAPIQLREAPSAAVEVTPRRPAEIKIKTTGD